MTGPQWAAWIACCLVSLGRPVVSAETRNQSAVSQTEGESPAGEGKALPQDPGVGPDTRRQAPLASPVTKGLRVLGKQASGPSSWTACTKSYRCSPPGLHVADSLWLPQQAPWSGPNVAAPIPRASCTGASPSCVQRHVSPQKGHRGVHRWPGPGNS